MQLQPKLIDPSGTHEFITVIPMDANWAGWSKTRKTTSGALIKILSVPVHFISNTQSVIAQSSAEGDLYGINSGIEDGLHMRSFVMEAALFNECHIGNANGLFKCKEHCAAVWHCTKDSTHSATLSFSCKI